MATKPPEIKSDEKPPPGAKCGPQSILRITSIFYGAITAGVFLGSFGSMIPDLAVWLNTKVQMVTLHFIVASLAGAVGAIVLNPMLDRYNPMAVVSISAAGVAIIHSICAFLRHIAAFVIVNGSSFFLLSGMNTGIYLLGAYFGNLYNVEALGSMIEIFISIGFAIGPLIVAPFLNPRERSQTPVTTTSMWLNSSNATEGTNQPFTRVNESLVVVGIIVFGTGVLFLISFLVSGQKINKPLSEATETPQEISHVANDAKLRRLKILFLLSLGAMVSFSLTIGTIHATFTVTLTVNYFGWTTQEATILSAVHFSCRIIVSVLLVLGMVLRKTPINPTAILWVTCGFLTLSSIILIAGSHVMQQQPWVLVTGSIIAGSGMASNFPMSLLMMQRTIGMRGKNTTIPLVFMLITRMTFPQIVAALMPKWRQYGFSFPLILASVLTMLGISLATYFARKYRACMSRATAINVKPPLEMHVNGENRVTKF